MCPYHTSRAMSEGGGFQIPKLLLIGPSCHNKVYINRNPVGGGGGGSGGSNHKSFQGRGMNIFWNNTILSSLLIMTTDKPLMFLYFNRKTYPVKVFSLLFQLTVMVGQKPGN